MAMAIRVVAVAIPIHHSAATTNVVLPAADSAAAVRGRCRCCRVGGPVGGVVVDDETVVADAPAASPLPLLGAMDLTSMATMKTLNGTVVATAMATAVATAMAMEEEELDCRDDGGRCGAASAESGDRNDVDACNQHWRVVNWAG